MWLFVVFACILVVLISVILRTIKTKIVLKLDASTRYKELTSKNKDFFKILPKYDAGDFCIKPTYIFRVVPFLDTDFYRTCNKFSS